MSSVTGRVRKPGVFTRSRSLRTRTYGGNTACCAGVIVHGTAGTPFLAAVAHGQVAPGFARSAQPTTTTAVQP